MAHGLEPVEEYDGRITVRVLDDEHGRDRFRVSSYRDAIDLVKARRGADRVVKIEDRDGDVVFTSATMDIEEWETEWTQAKRRLSAAVEKRDCPYDDDACFTDDPCVQCGIDAVQADQY